MPTETFTAGDDFAITGGVFNLTLTLEGEAGEGSGNNDGGEGGRVVVEVPFVGEPLFIRESLGGSSSDGGDGGKSIDVRKGGTTLQDRVAVAAGGGGFGSSNDGNNSTVPAGDGGPDSGENGDSSGVNNGTSGSGGDQSSGGAGGAGSGSGTDDGDDGALGSGGDGGEGDGPDGGGGGAGYYGGGGGGEGQPSSEFTRKGGAGAGGSNRAGPLGSEIANERGTSTRSHGQGGVVTAEYDLQKPAQNFRVADTTETSITLDWDVPVFVDDVESVEEWQVFRADEPGTTRADYTQVDTVTTPGYEDTGFQQGERYHYRLGATVRVPEADYQVTITGFREV